MFPGPGLVGRGDLPLPGWGHHCPPSPRIAPAWPGAAPGARAGRAGRTWSGEAGTGAALGLCGACARSCRGGSGSRVPIKGPHPSRRLGRAGTLGRGPRSGILLPRAPARQRSARAPRPAAPRAGLTPAGPGRTHRPQGPRLLRLAQAPTPESS